MSLSAFSLADPKASGEVRFQDLSDEEQDQIIKAFKNKVIPRLNRPDLTYELLWRWYVDFAVYKFWVEHRHLRDRSIRKQ